MTRILSALLILSSYLAAGCATNTSLAPPVASLPNTGSDKELLAEGRRVYLVDCTRCHQPVAVTDHDRSEWEEILARMVPLTGLDGGREAALRAYLDAAAPGG